MTGRVAVLLVTALMWRLTGTAVAAPLDDTAGTLIEGSWRGTVLGRSATGSFLLLVDDGGWVRLELAQGRTGDLQALMARRGEGWTVVTDPDGTGTSNAWGEEWRTLEPDLAALVARGGAAVAQAPAGLFATRRVVRREGGATDLRRRLVRRGRGRGGPGEVLRISGDSHGRVTIIGSRRPGHLELGPLRRHPVHYPNGEAFVPLWPLADIVVPDS